MKRTTLASVLSRLGARAHDCAAGAAADAWPQFRGNPQLTGVAPSALPATLKVLWTYEAGDSIESSAAIADGAVYVGVAGRARCSRCRCRTAVALEVQTQGRRRRVVAGRRTTAWCTSAISPARCTPCASRDGKAAWTFETEGEIKSSPVVSDGKVLIGSYDGISTRSTRRAASRSWTRAHRGLRARARRPSPNGVAYHHRLRRDVSRHSRQRRQGAVHAVVGRLHRRVAGARRRGGLLRHVQQRRAEGRSQGAQAASGATRTPSGSSRSTRRRRWPTARSCSGGRDKMVHALDAATGKARWTFATNARVESSPAMAGGRVYIGSNDGRFYVLDLAKRHEAVRVRMPAGRSPPPPPSPAAASSSGRRTARSTASDRHARRLMVDVDGFSGHLYASDIL